MNIVGFPHEKIENKRKYEYSRVDLILFKMKDRIESQILRNSEVANTVNIKNEIIE